MLLFWLRSKLILWGDFRDRMRGLQAKAFESEWKEISKIHEELWRSESEFLKEYTLLLDAMKYVERYVEFEKGMQKDRYRKELALPTEYSVSSETDKPLTLGVFEAITGDIERESIEVMNLYTLIKEQHSMISGNIRDRININLATSNIKLQKQLVFYTVILVVLTVMSDNMLPSFSVIFRIKTGAAEMSAA